MRGLVSIPLIRRTDFGLFCSAPEWVYCEYILGEMTGMDLGVGWTRVGYGCELDRWAGYDCAKMVLNSMGIPSHSFYEGVKLKFHLLVNTPRQNPGSMPNEVF